MNPIDYIDKGFTVFFALSVILFIGKWFPALVKQWHEFANSVDHFAKTVGDVSSCVQGNTEIAHKTYTETLNIVEELKGLQEWIKAHDDSAALIKLDQEEILGILREIEEELKGK